MGAGKRKIGNKGGSGAKKLNPRYESFLINGRAEPKNPEQLKVGDNVITHPVNENGERKSQKWNFYFPDGEKYGSDDVWGSDVTLTKVNVTNKLVKVEGRTNDNNIVKKTFKKSEKVFTRKKSK